MTAEILTEWDTAPDADLTLAAEAYASLDRPPLETHAAHPGAIGIVAARRDGELLAWACLYSDDNGAAWVEPITAARLVRRLSAGVYDAVPPDEDEIAAYEAMFRHAADQARQAGFDTLRWAGEDTGAAGEAARALGAEAVEEIARVWRADTATFRKPNRVQPVAAEPLPEGGVAAGTARITVDLGGTHAYVNAGEAVIEGGVGEDALAGLFAELVEYLRREHPRISALSVFEFDENGGIVRAALEQSGLEVDARAQNFELAL